VANNKYQKMSEEFVTITVDGRELKAPKGAMLIEVTDRENIHVPRFCYHDKLPIAANCRMCLVEVEKAPKPLPACATPVMEGMIVHTHSAKAKEAQRSVMEFLLINHPLDCPICDQGGECELQDVAMGYGGDVSQYSEGKRVVFDKSIGPLISTELTRCIHCTRCVRFGREIAGIRELGMTDRGENARIATYMESAVTSEMSGNVIDICPVGALTAKPSRFKGRAWEMVQHKSIAPHDCIGSGIYVHTLRGEVIRVVPCDNEAINEVWISDRDRFSYEAIDSNDRLTTPQIERNGEWQDCDWDTALAATVDGIRDALAGASDDEARPETEKLAALISPSATVEEMYLLQKLMRSLGSGSIDHRLRQSDFSDQADAPVIPWLGQDIAALENLDAALLIGSNVRKEQPIANHRLRKAAIKGAAISFVNTKAFDMNFPVAANIVVAQQNLVRELAAIAAAAYRISGQKAPASIAKVKPGAEHNALVKQLSEAENSTVLLGNLAAMHPSFSSLRALAHMIAQQTGSVFGYLSEGSNSAGAWLAGAVPHRGAGGVNGDDVVSGISVGEWSQKKPSAAILVHIEPEADFAHAQAMMGALKHAGFVVAISAFTSPALLETANVLLPAAAFTETSGSFVNAEGLMQCFGGANAPKGDARPAWKILRVLANLLELPGFDYMSSEQVRDELRGLCESIDLDNTVSDSSEIVIAKVSNGLQRAADVPIYAGDMLVRRAAALQQTADAVGLSVSINPADATALELDDIDSVIVKQGDVSAQLPLIIDASVPKGCAWIPLALRGSELLGGPFAEVTLEKASL
jgi:NADH-quinone oxidoreductase subunit G